MNLVLVGISKIRADMGLYDTKRHKTDNSGGDRNLLKRHFPELNKDIVHNVLPNTIFGYATIDDND